MRQNFLKVFALAILALVGVSSLGPNTAQGIALCSSLTNPVPTITAKINGIDYTSNASNPDASFTVNVVKGNVVSFTVYTLAEPSSQNNISYPGGSNSYAGPSSAGRSYTTSAMNASGKITVSILQNCSPAGDGESSQLTINLNVPPPINGVCATAHYNCEVGTSVNNASGLASWIWTCNGSDGGTNASCSQPKTPVNPVYPDLTASAPSYPSGDIRIGAPVAFTSQISNNGTAATGSSFYNSLQAATGAGGSSPVSPLTASSPNPMSALDPGESKTATASYTFTGQAGTRSIRFCADNNTSMAGSINEGTDSEGNNCSPWVNIAVTSGGIDSRIRTIPTIILTPPTNITSSSATSGGNVTFAGSSPVTERGVIWSPENSGVHADYSLQTKTNNGGGTGSFASSITGLKAGSRYYLKAYARNDVGVGYSAEYVFETLPGNPTVTTSDPANITQTSATVGGNTTATGSPSSLVSSMGIIWGTSSTALPTKIEASECTESYNGGCIGQFSINLTGLNPNTTYYYKAYATSFSEKTGYGAIKQLKTAAVPVNMSGTITSPASCEIQLGKSSCNVDLAWHVENPVNPRSYVEPAGVGGKEGDDNSDSFVVPKGGQTFVLKNGDVPLNQSNATADCAETLVWLNGACVTPPPAGKMFGTLTPSVPACEIPSGGNGCTIDLIWKVSFPEEPAYSAITYNEDNNKIEYKTDKQDGSATFSVPRGGRTFFLYNNKKSLVPTTDDYSGEGLKIGAECVLGTEWKGGVCSPIVVLGKFILTVNKIGPGAVSGSGSYEPNTEVPITATPDVGSSFDGWMGDCSGTNPSVSVLMDGNKTCTARFSLNTIITPDPGGGCSINQGKSCVSFPNSCGVTDTGTIQCDGACNAITPSDDLCPKPACGSNSAFGTYYGNNHNDPCSKGTTPGIINGIRDWRWTCELPPAAPVECKEIKRTTGVIEN